MVGCSHRPRKIKVGNNCSSNSDSMGIAKVFCSSPLAWYSRALDKNMPGLLSHVPVIADQPDRGKRGTETVNYQP